MARNMTGFCSLWMIPEKKDDVMEKFRFQICASDGSTPLGQTISVNVMADDRLGAIVRVHAENPGHEIVSYGFESDISEYERRCRLGLLS